MDDLEAARPLAGVVELLGPLAARFAAVALVSGRPADYLAEHASRRACAIWGCTSSRRSATAEYGSIPAWRRPPGGGGRPEGPTRQPAVRDSGAWLEDKQYAVAVHTRRVADPQRWAAPIDQAARQSPTGRDLRSCWASWSGSCARPCPPSDKGDAVRRVVAESGARSVLVAGDDLGDLPAFAAAAQLAAEGGIGLRVAVRSAEAPPDLLAEADLVVDGPPGLRELLWRLVA